MNILQILPSLDVGGVETGTIDLARYLVAQGHKVVTVSGGGRLVKELDAINSRHYRLPVGKKSPLNMIKMVRELCDIIRREDIDIVHARSRVPGLIAFIACKLTNRVFITTSHGYYKKHPLSAVMGWGKFVIVASNIMAKHMATNFAVPYERIRLIPRGVDLSHFKFRDPDAYHPKGFTVGMVSRITPLKGHADFIKAVAILNREIPNLKVLIVGSAPKDKYKDDLELLTRRLGLTNTIEFLPATQDVPAIMHLLDVLVSATTTPEAFGRVIIEAQASGIPVVATRVGGVVDIVEDEKTGLLCAANNPKEMAEKILRLYNDKALAARIVAAAKERVTKDYNVGTMTEKTVALYEEALKVQNILVIKMSAIGDVILSVPSLRAIRAKFPDANIRVLVGAQSREVIAACPYINGVIVCDFKNRHKGIKGLLRLGQEIRDFCPEIVIDLQNNRKSHILAALSLAPLRYGYDNGKISFLLNRKIKDDAPYLDPLDHQFRTLKIVGIKPLDKKLELWPAESDEKQAEKFLADNWLKPDQGLVGINVRASSRWLSKNWPAAYIAELCDRVAKEFNMRVVLTGAAEDADFAARIAKVTKSKPVAAAGRTSIMELAALIKKFKVYLTPDSAPMHIALAMGTPVIALFGPTDPARHIVPSDNAVVIAKGGDFKCAPCYRPDCSRKVSCMKKIAVEEVFGAMKKFLTKEI